MLRALRKHVQVFDIAADMTRQYKGMQEELLDRINELERQARAISSALAPILQLVSTRAALCWQINEQKDLLEEGRLQLDKEKRDKAQELAHKDAEIARQKQKMEARASCLLGPACFCWLRPCRTAACAAACLSQ